MGDGIMKITEIIQEGTKGELHTDHKHAFHKTMTYNDGHGAGYDYNFNRVGMAVAMSDGSNKKLDVDDRTWFHHDNVAVPYTNEEEKMFKQAFKSIKTKVNPVVTDHKSREPNHVNNQSPVAAKKKNRYGV